MTTDSTMNFNPYLDMPLMADLGDGDDQIVVAGPDGGQVRLTFTSAEVGNGMANDSGMLANQDGMLAVRLQTEGMDGMPMGDTSRVDDEGIRFVARAGGITFDVRDLVSGAQRGDQFQLVQLGTMGGDTYDFGASGRSIYVNAGQGDDMVMGGRRADFLVGGLGMDMLSGGLGNDSFIGGAGDDMVMGGEGRDSFTFAPLTDGMDMVDLGTDMDMVMVNAAAGSQVRLSFTSSEVGNGMANDSGTMAMQDGMLAVRLALEDGMDMPMATAGRFDDEGIRFVASAGATFDVRDLVSGAARGDQFTVAVLGTSGRDKIDESGSMMATYVNAGAGNDTVMGGSGADFLVGGLDNDMLAGGMGDDQGIGGAGNDRLVHSMIDGGADRFDLGDGMDMVQLMAAEGTQVRVTFTSAEVGNAMANDSGMLANQDGKLAVRLQAEDGMDGLMGPVSRVDDEGIRLMASEGVTFDVRDLVSGAARGDQFQLIQLGTMAADTIDEATTGRAIYVNAGQGDDNIMGGRRADFLVGGAGNDMVMGGKGADTLLGGSGNDSLAGGLGADVFLFTGTDGMDSIEGFVSGVDRVDLRPLALGMDAVMQMATADGLMLNIDRTGDGAADMSILLEGVSMLAAGDIWM